MADDFLGIPTDAAADVPAEIQSDGSVTEDFTGEQVADEAGNASWWDDNYPGQTTTSADSPTQDAYGLSILDAAQTQELTRNINPAFINSLNDPSIAQPVLNRLTGRPLESPVPYGNLTPDQQANRDARLAEEAASRVQNLDPNYWANKRQPSLVSDTGISVVLPGGSLQFADPAQYEAWSTDPGAFAVVNIGGVDTVQPYPQLPTASSATPVDPTTTEGFGIQAAVDPTTTEGFGVQAPVDPTTLEGYGIQAAVDPTTLEGFGVPGPAPLDVNQGGEGFGNIYPDGFGGFVNGDGQPVDDNGLLVPTGNNVTQSADPVNPIDTGYTSDAEQIAQGNLLQSANDAVADEAAQVEVGRQLAQQQAVNAAQKKSVNNGDWRVRLSLAPGARYLYNAPDPGILDPLTATDGVIFPYTPSIDMAYKADYDQYALTHSNYKGYFYKSSSTEAVQMKATFTAQDSAEANYLLAVIHFFRSVTKMFYGQDPQRGAPPPLVYLTGLGQYQFATHPCVVTSFSYQLPDSVDYIRARSTNINGTNLLTRRVRQDLPTNPISGAVGRLANLFSGQGISYGAEICRPPPPTLGQNQPTYVPTKMDINLTLLPVQSRRQVSQQFSLRGYANGDLLKRGFW
jgi:putative component of toxin-antitoxin plasmid stabilization module